MSKTDRLSLRRTEVYHSARNLIKKKEKIMSVVVGTGVVIVNSKGEVLLGKRSGKHAPYWSIDRKSVV